MFWVLKVLIGGWNRSVRTVIEVIKSRRQWSTTCPTRDPTTKKSLAKATAPSQSQDFNFSLSSRQQYYDKMFCVLTEDNRFSSVSKIRAQIKRSFVLKVKHWCYLMLMGCRLVLVLVPEDPGNHHEVMLKTDSDESISQRWSTACRVSCCAHILKHVFTLNR